ncbi:MAG: zinc ribbon domain-containing protein [Gaiellales bacterium]
MPIYEYRCGDCEQQFEEYLAASTAPVPTCPACSSAKVERLWSSFATEWKPSSVNWHRVGSSWGTKPPKKNF